MDINIKWKWWGCKPKEKDVEVEMKVIRKWWNRKKEQSAIQADQSDPARSPRA